MPIFDQRGQQVTYQYNAAGTINIGAVQDRAELSGELRKLQGKVDQAERPTPNKNGSYSPTLVGPADVPELPDLTTQAGP
jgi:hypothetical protein